jgi:hypothetical protein
MTRYTGGTKVAGGYFLNLRTWDFQAVDGKDGVLPGNDTFLHLPAVVVLPAALVLSFVFVVFLPAIGLGLAAYALARKSASMFGAGAGKLAETMAPSYRPGMAFFARDGKKDEPAEAPRASETMTELEKDIAARRETEKKA